MKKVVYDYGYNVFASKDALRTSFYSDFYYFLKEKTDFDLSSIDVKDAKGFIAFCTDWNALGKENLYGPGDTLNPYFLTPASGKDINSQEGDTFLGYVYKQGKYQEFIEFLPLFFRYWRKDEGCDCFGPVDTYDFYYRAWDSLVDTLKFFYFTSETLKIKYPWYKSVRVRNALDEVPSVHTELKEWEEFDGSLELKPVNVNGYEFKGWFLDKDYKEEVKTVNSDVTVYAKLEKI